MLPLVERIARDCVDAHTTIDSLHLELARLDRCRSQLDWPSRAHRYALEDDLTSTQKRLRTLANELDALGLHLLDSKTGLVGFPTMVNDQRAWFNWRPGEVTIEHWNFVGHTERHPVPPQWTEMPRERPRRVRSRKKSS
jgi:hypothetical protein